MQDIIYHSGVQRIYYSELKSDDKTLVIKDFKIFHQLVKVLRLKKGDYVTFFNGQDDKEYLYTIHKVEKKEIVFSIFDVVCIENDIDFTLDLYAAIPNKLDKMEYVVQKGTEVGYSNFYFYRSDRSQSLLLSPNKIERLKRIIIEAVEQSGRHKVPEFIVLDKIPFDEMKGAENICFHTSSLESIAIKNLKLDYTKKVNIFIGPEGGFSDREVIQFEKSNFTKVFLGNRILRTETAPIVAGFYIIQNY